jgi:hypothetical protein
LSIFVVVRLARRGGHLSLRQRHVAACRPHYPNVLAGNDISERLAALQPHDVRGDVVDAAGEGVARVDSKQLISVPLCGSSPACVAQQVAVAVRDGPKT